MLSWNFPQIINNSYSGNIQKGFIEENVTIPERRETFTDISDFISGYIILEGDERNSFIEFFQQDTRRGTIPFEYYDCTTSQTRIASFEGPPQDNKISNKYKFNITLRLEPLEIQNKEPLQSTDRITEDDQTRITEGADTRITE